MFEVHTTDSVNFWTQNAVLNVNETRINIQIWNTRRRNVNGTEIYAFLCREGILFSQSTYANSMEPSIENT